MARTLFGGGEASYFLPGTGSTAVVYGTEAGAKAKTSADVVSDLLAADGVTAQSQIVARGIGTYSFYGPDGRTSPLWVSDGVGGAIRIDPNPNAAYAPKPTNAGTTGQAIVKQADGTVAFATVSGGGSAPTQGVNPVVTS